MSESQITGRGTGKVVLKDRLRPPQIKMLLTKMQEYWYSPKSDEETRILYSYALYGRNLGYAYTGEFAQEREREMLDH